MALNECWSWTCGVSDADTGAAYAREQLVHKVLHVVGQDRAGRVGLERLLQCVEQALGDAVEALKGQLVEVTRHLLAAHVAGNIPLPRLLLHLGLAQRVRLPRVLRAFQHHLGAERDLLHRAAA